MKKIIVVFVAIFFALSSVNAFALNFDVELNNVYSNQKPTNLSDFIGKKLVLAVFFYPQCHPCQKSSKVINKVYKKYKKDIIVVGISLSKDRYDIEDFVEDFGVKYPVYRIANKNQLRNVGGIFATPTSILIGKDGKIIKKIPGIVDFEYLSATISKYIK